MAISDRFYSRLNKLWRVRPNSWRPQLGDQLAPVVIFDDARQLHIPPISPIYGFRASEGVTVGAFSTFQLVPRTRALLVLDLAVNSGAHHIGILTEQTLTGPTAMVPFPIQHPESLSAGTWLSTATLQRGSLAADPFAAFSPLRLVSTSANDMGIIILPGQAMVVANASAATAIEVKGRYLEYPDESFGHIQQLNPE